MTATVFTDVLSSIGPSVLFIAGILLAVAAVCGLWVLAMDHLEGPVLAGAAAGLLVVIVAGIAVFITLGVSLWGGRSSDTFSTSGGMGPDTVCWWAEVDQADTVVMAGNTPVIIDGGTNIDTVCAKDPDAIPPQILAGTG